MKKILVMLMAIMPCMAICQETDTKADSKYVKSQSENSVVFDKFDGSGYVQLELLAPASMVNTTKDYAQMLMDSYGGFDLQAHVQLRGYSFLFVDNAPCVAVVSYFDGSNHLLFKSCGEHDKKELKDMFSKAAEDLKISDRLSISSRASFY